jgi:hypothetical protein
MMIEPRNVDQEVQGDQLGAVTALLSPITALAPKDAASMTCQADAGCARSTQAKMASKPRRRPRHWVGKSSREEYETVTTKHQRTREEEVYGQLLEEIWEKLSEPARAVIGEAESAAHRANMVHSYSFQPEEYEEATEKMRRSAAELTDRDCELLKEVVRAAMVACASIDPFDVDTLVGYRVYRVDLHWYYRTASDMVRNTLYEQIWKREWAESESGDDLSDVPF